MTGFCARLAWLLPAAFFSEDALAWGLCTHIYFSQLLIWAIPLADPRFRRAVARLPEFVLAGACLPDVSLFSKHVGAAALGTTHQWSAAQRLLASAHDDESRALALGYASHLLADIIAHNHFVPADGSRIADYAVEQFGCSRKASRLALGCLKHGEALLRSSHLPQVLLRSTRALDSHLMRRLDWYVAETAGRLGQINRLIDGDAPAWHAEIDSTPAAHQRARLSPARDCSPHSPFPQDLF